MRFTAIIEQTYHYQKRMKYIPETNSFIEKEGWSLGYTRNAPQPYGWIKESGTPPQPHLDVYIMTDKEFELGDETPVNIIGVFQRCDGDHKLIGVLDDRSITDLSELTEQEIETLHRLYPGKYEGDAWLGRDGAERIVREFMETYKQSAG